MDVRVSFWNWFTREGRVRNHWASALADPNAVRGLDRLRRVLQELRSDTTSLGHLAIPFLESFLDPCRVAALAESDLADLEESAFSGWGQVPAEDIWLLVLQAYDIRGAEQPARALLTRIC